MSKIIDFEKHGNVVRLYLGDNNCDDYGGDDWNDTPYEHNAGTVYKEYVTDTLDFAMSPDSCVVEPAEDWHYHGNSEFCKDDFKFEKAPCLVVCPREVVEEKYCDPYYTGIVGDKRCFQIYYNTVVNADFKREIKNRGGIFFPKPKA